MNARIKFGLAVVIAFAAGALLVFYLHKPAEKPVADADEKPAAENAAPAEIGTVKLDAETQTRIGLQTTNPAASDWQPEIKAYGRVIDPALLAVAAGDLETARVAADASAKELQRMKSLAADDNISARNLEAVQTLAIQNQTALASARAKFILDWGKRLAENSGDVLRSVLDGKNSLVRVDLPPGENLKSPPRSAQLWLLNDRTDSVNADFFDVAANIDPQTQMQSFLFVTRNVSIIPGTAVSAAMKMDGEKETGVVVPSSAILRHEGKTWVYVQSSTNEFSRVEISTDKFADNGWFVSENLSTTNRIVVSGAQTLLSAELTGGGFNAGGRD